MHDAGFRIHTDFRHLRSSDLAGNEVIVSTLTLARSGDGRGSELGASLLPGNGLAGIALDANLSVDRLEIIGLCGERRSHFLKELVQRRGGSTARGRTDAANRRGASGGSIGRILRIADVELHGLQRESHGFRGDDADDCARARPKVLRSERYFYS